MNKKFKILLGVFALASILTVIAGQVQASVVEESSGWLAPSEIAHQKIDHFVDCNGDRRLGFLSTGFGTSFVEIENEYKSYTLSSNLLSTYHYYKLPSEIKQGTYTVKVCVKLARTPLSSSNGSTVCTVKTLDIK